jgi:hypothetical protein
MTPSTATLKYRAVSMEFAVDFDARNVEMRIRTDAGKTISIVCSRNSILAVQKHIDQMADACPEIATWGDRVSVDMNPVQVSPPTPRRRLPTIADLMTLTWCRPFF